MPQFPKDWPSDCPPPEAEAAAGDYFRVARANPPKSDEFLSYAELGQAPKGPPCKRAGLSLLRKKEDAIHQTQLFPKHGTLIFRGELTDEHGKTQLTKGTLPTHTTWWPCEGVDRSALFSFVMEAS